MCIRDSIWGCKMDEKMKISGWEGRKKIIISSVTLIFLLAIIIIFLSAKPYGKVAYITTNGSGDFNCDGIDDQVEINKALAYVAENPQFTTVHLEGNTTYIISDSILIGSNTILEGDSTSVLKQMWNLLPESYCFQ